MTKSQSKKQSKKQFKSTFSRINPPVKEGADFLVDYLFRVLIFLFPLYTYETKAVMGITGKDLLAGIIVLIVGLWCLYKSLKKNLFQSLALDSGKAFGVLVFLALLIVLGIQFVGSNGEVAHTFLYIVAMLLFFSSYYVGGGTRFYLGLLAASFTLVYVSLYLFIFTGTATILRAESLLSKPRELAPFLMLSILIMSILYLIEKNANLQKLYLFLAGTGMILFFLYGDMMGFCMMFLMIMGLCYIQEPTVGNVKRSLFLTFLYGFCASNAPLITYFGAKGIKREFDLEYSIYIDIVIAVVGLIVTSSWDKMENKDQDEADASAALKWYGRGMILVSVILFIAFIFGSKGASLQNSFGGKALYGFTNSMWEAAKNSSGELWHVLQVYGVIGVTVLIALGFALTYRIVVLFKDCQCDAVEKGYLAIAVLFLIQGFFYPYSSMSLPLYMIMAGIGVTTPVALKDMESAAEKLAKESTVSSDESDLHIGTVFC